MSPEFVFDLVVKSTVIFAIGWVATMAMYRASAASRHAVWAAVCVAALVLPAAQVVLPTMGVSWWPQVSTLWSPREVAPEVQASTVSTTAVGSPASSSDTAVVRGTWGPGRVLGLMWLAGLVVGLGRFVRARHAASRLTSATEPVTDVSLGSRAELIAAWLGVARYELRVGPADLMPATWGTQNPVVVLPSVAVAWPQARLDPVLVHELAHVQRRDARWLQLSHVMLAVWWMHPLAWMAARRLRMERERACDDLALAFGSRASDYASELVSLAGECGGTELTLAMARRSQLEGRVMAILNPRVNRDGRTRLATALAAVVVLAVVPMASLRAVTAVLPSAPAIAAPQQQPVRIGGQVGEPKKIKHVAPVYPEDAIAAGVQGIVIVEAVIDPEGVVSEAKAIRPVALLTDAALDAVYQWRFLPTQLNGVPVPVIMTVTVNFRLDEDGRPLPPPPPPAPPAPPAPPTGDVPPPPPAPPAPPTPMLAPPPPPTWNPGDPPLRIGGLIKEPKKIKHVAPVYPAEAQESRVQGIVIIEARIDQDGRVSDARIIRPVALLDQAALDAVMQWEFLPTLLDGQPVPVIMTVTVNFTLQ
jgi:TonB family protein